MSPIKLEKLFFTIKMLIAILLTKVILLNVLIILFVFWKMLKRIVINEYKMLLMNIKKYY